MLLPGLRFARPRTQFGVIRQVIEPLPATPALIQVETQRRRLVVGQGAGKKLIQGIRIKTRGHLPASVHEPEA